MKNIIIKTALLCLSTSIILSAHKPNLAYFKAQKKGKAIEIIAELPWTFRPALLKEFPDLEDKKSPTEFKKAIFKYFKKNIVVEGSNQKIKLEEVLKIEQEHSHSVAYKLIYKSNSDFKKLVITNTCLFEINDDQRNVNSFIYSDEKNVQFNTTKSNNNYQIEKL